MINVEQRTFPSDVEKKRPGKWFCANDHDGQPGVRPDYLQRNGTWRQSCRFGWFDTKEEILLILKRQGIKPDTILPTDFRRSYPDEELERKYTYNNPNGLRLGELVAVAQKCCVGYDEHGNKDVHFLSKGNPISCRVMGSVKKGIGKYTPAGHPFHPEEDPEPPHLVVSKYVWLYECRETLAGKPFLVHPDHITIGG